MSTRCEVSYQKIREAASRLPEKVRGAVGFLKKWLAYSGDPLRLYKETKPEAPSPPLEEPRLTNAAVVKLRFPRVSVSLRPQKVNAEILDNLPCNQECCSRLDEATIEDLDKHPGKNQRLDLCENCPIIAPSLPSVVKIVSEIVNRDMAA